MARGANLNLELLLGGAHGELIAARAINFRLMIGWMDVFLHYRGIIAWDGYFCKTLL